MRIGRTLPPAAAPLSFLDLLNGISGFLFPNRNLQIFRNSLCDVFSKRYCFLLSSGKAAITVTLKALSEIAPDRKEVIIPAFDCYSVPSAITSAGLIAKPCEINPGTLTFDYSALSKILQNNTSILAIMPTHLFGLPEDIKCVRKLITDKNIVIIEDAAQAMGTTYNKKLLGTEGDIGIFSLARGKAISAGEGGIIITNSDEFAKKISHQLSSVTEYSPFELFKLIMQSIALTILLHPFLFWIPKSLPFLKLGETIYDPNFPIRKLSGFQAGLLKNWKKKIDWLTKERSRCISEYLTYIKGTKGISGFFDKYKTESISCIRFPITIQNVSTINKLLTISENLGFGISKSYPGTIDTIESKVMSPETAFLNARKIVNTLITLPCHPYVSSNDIKNISNLLLNACHSSDKL